jgi:hypothetical protein
MMIEWFPFGWLVAPTPFWYIWIDVFTCLNLVVGEDCTVEKCVQQ